VLSKDEERLKSGIFYWCLQGSQSVNVLHCFSTLLTLHCDLRAVPSKVPMLIVLSLSFEDLLLKLICFFSKK